MRKTKTLQFVSGSGKCICFTVFLSSGSIRKIRYYVNTVSANVDVDKKSMICLLELLKLCVNDLCTVALQGVFPHLYLEIVKVQRDILLDRYIHMHITLLRKTGSEEQQHLLN